jgi:hypothetical protein
VTPRRYAAYRTICTELEGLTTQALAEGERKLLRDVAEGLLLARDDEDEEIDELRTKAAVSLSLLVGLGRWSDAAADEVWERLVACGPLDNAGARMARAVQHA